MELVQQYATPLAAVAILAALAWLNWDAVKAWLPKSAPAEDDTPEPCNWREPATQCRDLLQVMRTAGEVDAVAALETVVWPAIGRLDTQRGPDDPAN